MPGSVINSRIKNGSLRARAPAARKFKIIVVHLGTASSLSKCGDDTGRGGAL
jgi:hypothetical protein